MLKANQKINLLLITWGLFCLSFSIKGLVVGELVCVSSFNLFEHSGECCSIKANPHSNLDWEKDALAVSSVSFKRSTFVEPIWEEEESMYWVEDGWDEGPEDIGGFGPSGLRHYLLGRSEADKRMDYFLFENYMIEDE